MDLETDPNINISSTNEEHYELLNKKTTIFAEVII